MKSEYILTVADDSHDDSHDDQLLIRYLGGEFHDQTAASDISASDISGSGVSASSVSGDELQAINQFVYAAALVDVNPPDIQRVLNAMRLHMDATDMGGRKESRRSILSRSSQLYSRFLIFTSAVIVLVAVASLSWGSLGMQKSVSGGVQSVYATAKGQRSIVTLSDGTRVNLNVDSRLEVPDEFNSTNRIIHLDGEAHFDVIPNSKLPFVVVTKRSTTRVLGTIFVVREYPSDTLTTVNVQSGEVAVQSGDIAIQNVVVSGNQQVSINGAGMVRLGDASPTASSFIENILSLSETPLSEAIVELGRWYNVEIRLNNPALEQQRVTGKFAMGSLNDLIGILQMAFDVEVVREGRLLTIYSE